METEHENEGTSGGSALTDGLGAMDDKPTYYCLGNGERGCNGCGTERNWQVLNELPDEFRKMAQATFTRVDDTECILRGRPWYTKAPNAEWTPK